MSLATPRFGYGGCSGGLSSSTHASQLAGAAGPGGAPGSVTHFGSMNDGNPFAPLGLSSPMGMGMGLHIPTSTRNSLGSSSGFNPNIFEMDTGESPNDTDAGSGNPDATFLIGYEAPMEDSVPNPNPTGGKKERRKRKIAEVEVENTKQPEPGVMSGTGAGAAGGGAALGPDGDASVQAAVLITYQIASKSASIDELMQLFAPSSSHPLLSTGTGTGTSTATGGVGVGHGLGSSTRVGVADVGGGVSGDSEDVGSGAGVGVGAGAGAGSGHTVLPTSLSAEALHCLGSLPPLHHPTSNTNTGADGGGDYIVLGGSVNTSPLSQRNSPTAAAAAGRLLVESSYKKKSPKAIII